MDFKNMKMAIKDGDTFKEIGDIGEIKLDHHAIEPTTENGLQEPMTFSFDIPISKIDLENFKIAISDTLLNDIDYLVYMNQEDYNEMPKKHYIDLNSHCFFRNILIAPNICVDKGQMLLVKLDEEMREIIKLRYTQK